MLTKSKLTIFSGPPRSGKSAFSKELENDPTYPTFIKVEGHNETKTINQIFAALDAGKDVVYETTHSIDKISQRLLDRVDTIEIFRVK